MEHESFEDADIAELMNQHFINVQPHRARAVTGAVESPARSLAAASGRGRVVALSYPTITDLMGRFRAVTYTRIWSGTAAR